MSKNLPVEESEAWYKQFWPWFLIGLPATVVVAGITTVVIANKGADDLVVDEYYKDGLAINRKLEKKQRAADLGVHASLNVSGKDITVSTGNSVNETELQLSLSHPLESDRDFQVKLIQSTPGQYLGRLSADVAPRWHWALSAQGEEGWRLDGSFTEADFNNPGGE